MARRASRVRRDRVNDVFLPAMIWILILVVLSALLAFGWQKYQDKYDPDYMHPKPGSFWVSENASQEESSSPEAVSSSEPQPEPEPETPAIVFGEPVPETERIHSSYFDDAIFIGDSITTGIQLYGVLPNTTVLASTGINLDNIRTKQALTIDGEKMTILEASKRYDAEKIYIMLGANGLSTLGVDTTVQLYREFAQSVKEAHPDAIIYIQSILPVNEQKFAANYSPALQNSLIDECNEALLEMAGELEMYYLDINSAIRDETGGLPADFTSDGLHFKSDYYNKWIDYLKTHAVTKE